MMTLIERIKADQIIARKAKDSVKTTLLSTLLGEITAVGKNNGNRETTDAEAIAVIKKFKKNVEDTQSLIFGSSIRPMVYTDMDAEIDLYESYLPKQLSETELKSTIRTLKTHNSNIQMKDIMSYLKENFAGLYDGKLASTLANKILKE
jgi:uncharacterized protein YqeY